MDQRQYKKPGSPVVRAAGMASEGSAKAGSAAKQGKTTTRAELLDAVYNVCPLLSRAQARAVFEMTLDEIVDALMRDEAVKLRAFGAFNVRSKRERVGRNPRTGVEATINARRVLTFKASPTLIARVNGLAAPSESED